MRRKIMNQRHQFLQFLITIQGCIMNSIMLSNKRQSWYIANFVQALGAIVCILNCRSNTTRFPVCYRLAFSTSRIITVRNDNEVSFRTSIVGCGFYLEGGVGLTTDPSLEKMEDTYINRNLGSSKYNELIWNIRGSGGVRSIVMQ